jgi:hypothetical protein
MTADQDHNKRTVFVVQNDARKDYSDAKRYGALKDVFGNVTRHYNTPRMIDHARRVLSNWQSGDYLLIAGDPTLCGVCMGLVAAKHGVVDVLRWDKIDFQYTPQRWDFDEEINP